MYDLDIIIPALREEFLVNTVEDICKNKRGKTGVIVVLDGEWATPSIPDHPDVRIIYTKNLGQRGATNLGVRLSTAKYVAKCDAHVAFDEGFDVKLMDALKGHDDWTIVPVMRNLHVFNWKCKDCGDESYQGPEPEGCKNCNVNTPDRFEKKIVWYAKPSPNSSAFKFTPNRLQFKYFGALKDKQQKSGETIVESMSLQGSFFMLTRDKYWELNICDESWGGWGQQGTEVALKTWLSGGRVVCHLGTWYAHMFRTQSGFAFPWGNPAKQQDKARKTSWELFTKNQWDKQVRPLSWVVERFWDTLQEEPNRDDDPKWTQADLDRVRGSTAPEPSKGVIYYTDSRLEDSFGPKVRDHLQRLADKHNLPIVSSSLQPLDFGKNIHINAERGYLTMFKQILACLEESTADIIYFCEHDVLYHSSHFDFTPPNDSIYYNHNWYCIGKEDKAIHWDADRVGMMCGPRQKFIDFYKQRIATFDPSNFDRKFEPLSNEGAKVWKSEYPNIDIRHGKNLTLDKWSLDDFRDKTTAINLEVTTIDKIPGWKPRNFSDIL